MADNLLAAVDVHNPAAAAVHSLVVRAADRTLGPEVDSPLVADHIRLEHHVDLEEELHTDLEEELHTDLEVEHHTDLEVEHHSLGPLGDERPARLECRMKSQ